MRIGSIGRSFENEPVELVGIHSTRTLLDFDVVILDLDPLRDDLGKSSNNFNSHQRRRKEIEELLKLGRTVVVFLADYPLRYLLPIDKVATVACAGNRTEFREVKSFKEFWKSIGNLMCFRAHLNAQIGAPFLLISQTDRVVGTWIQIGTGNLILLPSLAGDRVGHLQYADVCSHFVKAVKKLVESLNTGSTIFELPEWSLNYGWTKVQELARNLNQLQTDAEELERKIAESKDAFFIEERLKVLLSAKGDVLVDALIPVFEELGVKVNKGEPGRDDLILEFGERRAVVEVKGKKGSAAESDAAQLEKWVAGFKEEKEGVNLKGILLINAYCDTPLTERKDPPFPHQMLKYSTQREHCLVTTTQLLGLLFQARAHPEKKAELVNELFSAVGTYEKFADRRTFLSFSDPKSPV